MHGSIRITRRVEYRQVADHRHCSLMLAARITLAHFSVSSTMSFSNSAGDIGAGTLPRSARRALIDLGVGEGGVDFLVEPVDDFGSRSLGRADALPGAGLEAGDEIAHGRHLRQRLRARRGGHRQRAHLAGFDGLDRLGQGAEHHLHLSADEVGERRRASAIRHMEHVDASQQLEQLSPDMGRASAAARRHADLARIGLGVGDELGNRPGRDRWIYFHDKGQVADHCDRSDVVDEIEVEFIVQCRVHCHRRGDQEQGIAVRGCAHDCLDADIGARARPVLDDECLPEPLRQPLADQAGEDVERAAGSHRHDDAHRPRRIGLRSCDARECGKRGSSRGQMQECAAGECHDALLGFSHFADRLKYRKSGGGWSFLAGIR